MIYGERLDITPLELSLRRTLDRTVDDFAPLYSNRVLDIGHRERIDPAVNNEYVLTINDVDLSDIQASQSARINDCYFVHEN